MSSENTEMVQAPNEQLEHVRAERRLAPPVDVFESEEEILLLVDVPGVDDDGLDVRLNGGQLDLEARQARAPAEELGYEPVVFARTFAMPNVIDGDNVAAELERGVLRIHLPKSKEAKPRRIAVKAG